MKRLILLPAMLIFLLSAPVSADTLLASFDYTGIGQLNGTPQWQPFLSYGDPDDPGSFVMNNATLDFLAVANGTQLELSGDFASFAALATNGLNQPLFVGFRVPGGTGSQQLTTELDLLNTGVLAPGIGSPDFVGYSLSRIVVLGSSFQSLGRDSFETSVNFSVYGNAVPEPASAALVGLAAVTAIWLRRRNRSTL